MKSTCVSTSQRTVPLTTFALQPPPRGPPRPLRAGYPRKFRALVPKACRKSLDELEPLVRAEAAADLRRLAPVCEHDVGGEVVRAADERRADAVRVDRHAPLLELADLLDGETTRGDDLHVLEPVGIERVAHAP